jgi:glucose dehydrogenase
MSLRSNREFSLLYQIAIVLAIIWAVGYFGFHTNDLIHIILGLAIVLVIIRILKII